MGDFFFGESPHYNLTVARGFYALALFTDRGSPYVWHQLARIDFLRGDFDSALVKINRQIELHGDRVSGSYYVRGLIRGFQGELAGAEADFKIYLKFHPKSWGAHNDLAWVYFQAGKYQEALQAARQGLLFSPKNPWLLTSVGGALLNLNRLEEARQTLSDAKQEAAQLEPADWSRSNPGNDPRIAEEGLAAMRAVIERNLMLVDKLQTHGTDRI